MAVVTNPSIDAKTRGIIVHIVEQIKSQGVFDRFRRECLEELDSKEPYRQLKQRVESHVATFLSKQVYSSSMPKNQLRTSLRTNISQSEVLSKGVDRLLEQVLLEKSTSFYSEIEGLVHDYLASIGHYSRIERGRQQRAGIESAKLFISTQSTTAVPEVEKNVSKLSDKEIDDFIKEETTRFLEATAEEKIKEKMANLTHGLASSIEESLPASKDVTEAATDSNVEENEKNVEPDETKEPDSSAILESFSKPVDDIPTSSQELLKGDDHTLAKAVLELPSENAKEIEKSSEEKTDNSKEEEKRESENCSSDDNKPSTSDGPEIMKDGPEIMKDGQNKIAMKTAEVASPNAVSLNLKATPMSTDEETDDNGDSGILTSIIPKANISEDKSEEVNLKVSDSELSDSITVSSVHTSDLSSLEDSLSDLEFEDFKAMSKEMSAKSNVSKGSCVQDTDTSDALVGSSGENNNIATSDADDEAAMGNSDSGCTKPGDPSAESSQTSSQQEDKDSDLLAEGQNDPLPQRRSARVASKDKIKVDESDEVSNMTTRKPSPVSKSEESRKVRRKRREIIENKKRKMAGHSRKDVDEMSNEITHQCEQTITSDSNESENVKQSKRSKRKIRPTQCYSP